MNVEFKLEKTGKESAKLRNTRFDFHHFRVTMGKIESDITLVHGIEKGIVSAWCVTGLGARNGFSKRASGAIHRMAEKLAADPTAKEMSEMVNNSRERRKR